MQKAIAFSFSEELLARLDDNHRLAERCDAEIGWIFPPSPRCDHWPWNEIETGSYCLLQDQAKQRGGRLCVKAHRDAAT